jgi:tRNA U34 5-methylaminomethyl-2-thiouridine-forming methyltransferase MnmC
MSTPTNNQLLPPAEVEWGDDGVPVSLAYDDPYFAREDGFGETRHVFLSGNGLPDRFSGRDRFQIAELGFGTGLNFFATVAAWRLRPDPVPAAQLTFTSFELAPLPPPDMARAAARWPELLAIVEDFLADWPSDPRGGVHRVLREDVTLELVLGDANETLAGWAGNADAWYLDGFSPARNPDLWSADLMRRVFERTAPGGTFATYTVAGWVRRNLEAAGFELEKFPGYGRKRESLRGGRPLP